MRSIRTPALAAILLSVLLTACGTTREIRSSFFRHVEHRYGTEQAEILEVISYQDEEDNEPIFRVYATYPMYEGERWAMIWVDYGLNIEGEWIPIRYPASPADIVDTYRQAQRSARDHHKDLKARRIEWEP